MHEASWLPVEMADAGYFVSDTGRVRGPLRELKIYADRYGYMRAAMRKERKAVFSNVHTLVALAFLGPRPEGMVVDHIDGNKSNNHLANLRYISVAENNRSMAALRKVRAGRVLSEEQVAEIKAVVDPGHPVYGIKPVAKKFGVDPKTVREIADDRRWRHVAAKSGWRAIESAPNEEEILVVGLQHGIGPGCWCAVAIHVDGFWLTDRDDPDNTLHEPTHWRPLPPPPDYVALREPQS